MNKSNPLSCAVFLRGATSKEHFPKTSASEVVFLGRSNVGKSSLINAVTGIKGLARSSNYPGRTQQINFFSVPKGSPSSDASKLILVDLPGYGYAKVPNAVKQSMADIINDYLSERENITKVFLCIDSRHELKGSDLYAIEEINHAKIPIQLLLTKADKKDIPRDYWISTFSEIKTKFLFVCPEIMFISIKDPVLVKHLRSEILKLI